MLARNHLVAKKKKITVRSITRMYTCVRTAIRDISFYLRTGIHYLYIFMLFFLHFFTFFFIEEK